MDRRNVLWLIAAGAAFPLLERVAGLDLRALGRQVHAAASPPDGPGALRALDAHANRTVILAAERIVPATATPGATAAGVNRFIDVMLADWYAPAERDRFLAGLKALDARCVLERGSPFAECTEEQQVAVLSAYDEEVAAMRRGAEAARAGGRSGDPAGEHWFGMLKFLTIWGYCTSEAGMTEELREYPLAGRFDGCAPAVAEPSRGGDAPGTRGRTEPRR